jgi:hypothetical protein
MDELIILKAISSTEESAFYEFLRGLGSEAPERGDRTAFFQLFRQLDKLENDGLIEISRNGEKIDGMILTESGVARVKAAA